MTNTIDPELLAREMEFERLTVSVWVAIVDDEKVMLHPTQEWEPPTNPARFK